LALMEFTFEAAVMIVFAVLLFAACLWALVAARDYVLATRSGAKPTLWLVVRTASPGIAIALLGVGMYLFAISVT